MISSTKVSNMNWFDPNHSRKTCRWLTLLFTTTLKASLISQRGRTQERVAEDSTRIAFFAQKIRPLLAKHCYSCHSSNAEKLKGGLRLDSRQGWQSGGDSGEPATIPRRADESLLIAYVKHQGENPMPPDYKLPDDDVAALVQWVNLGAPDPRDDLPATVKRADKSWWSLQPLRINASLKQRSKHSPSDCLRRHATASNGAVIGWTRFALAKASALSAT